MVRVNFIDAKYLKSNTSIEENVDDDKLMPSIRKMQDVKVQGKLNSSFYHHLMDQVANNTLTTDEEFLIRNYIQPMLCEWAFHHATIYMKVKFNAKSVSTEKSEHSNPIDNSELIYTRNDIRDLAELYTKRLETYLNNNNNLFPLYSNPTDNLVPVEPKNYFGGIYMEKK